MRRFRAGLRMRLIRRRDYAVMGLRSSGERPRSRSSSSRGSPSPRPPAGYFLKEATAAELAELRRGGYSLLQAIKP